VLADINQDLMATYRALRLDPRAVHRELMRLPLGRKAYYKIRAIQPTQLPLPRRAAHFIYLNRFSFNGLYRTNAAGMFNVPFSGSRTGSLPSEEHLTFISHLLRRVKLRAGDFANILDREVQRGDFVYLDPPYAVSNRRLFRQYGPDTFGLDDLSRLRDVLNVIDRRGAYFLLSYASSNEANEYFGHWPRRRVTVQRNIAGFARSRRRAVEFLFTNLQDDKLCSGSL
jgi:DNA adenine methylase